MRLAIEAQESQIKASKSILSMQSNDILFDPGYCNFTRLHGSDEGVHKCQDTIYLLVKHTRNVLFFYLQMFTLTLLRP